MSKRLLSLLMAFVFCISMLPAAVLAEGGAGNIISDSSIGESSEGGGVLVPSGGTTEYDGTDGGAFTSLPETLNKVQDGVTVSECDHNGANGFDSNAASCPTCGANAVAQTALKNVEGNPWRNFADLQTAINADRDSGSTFRLLTDVTGNYTIDSSQNTEIDLNGHSINGTVTVTGGTNEISFSRTNDTDIVQKVIAGADVKFATPKRPAVIGTLELADGATWENIVSPYRNPGYKVYKNYPNLSTYEWYAPEEVPDRFTELNNVSVERLPITSKNLYFKVNDKKVSSVDRGTNVRLCAYCNTSGATVTFYVKEPDSDDYTQHTSEYKKIGTTWYYIAEYTFDKIGGYEVYFIASKDGYTVTSAPKKLNVTKATIPVSEITAPNGLTLTYNGKQQKLIKPGKVDPKYGTMVYSLKSSGVFTEEIPTEINVRSTYRVYYKVIGADGYKDSKAKSVTAKIEAVKIKGVNNVTSVSKGYDGSADVTLPKDNVTFFDTANQAFYFPESAYTITNARFTTRQDDFSYQPSPNAGTGKSISFTLTLTDNNYVLEGEAASVRSGDFNFSPDDDRFTISPAAIDLSKTEFTQIIYNDLAKTYEIDLKPMLEDVLKQQKPAGVEYGSIQYKDCEVNFTHSVYLDSGNNISVSNEGILSLPIASAHTAAVGTAIGTLNAIVDTTNYGQVRLPITVKVGERITPVPAEGFTVSATDITYGQTLADSTLTATGSMICPRTQKVIQGKFKWTDSTIKPDAAGTYNASWTFTPDEGYEEYAVAIGTVTVNVNKADIPKEVITPPAAKSGLVYNGDENGYELITPGTTTQTGITMQYKLGKDGEWSTEIPKATDAGSYDVYYKVFGNENYNDTVEARVEGCAIAKRPVTISNKQEGGYKTEYMYGDPIQKPDKSNFEITGSEGEPQLSYQWIGAEPQSFSELGNYILKVTVDATANTAGGSSQIPVKIVRNTRENGYSNGFGYMVYNNTATVSYDIDYINEIDPNKTVFDRESFMVKDAFTIKVKDANGGLITYDENTCDFKIAVTEGAAKGTLHVELTGLNREITKLSFCAIVVQAEDKHYENIVIEVRPQVEEKTPQTLGVTMNDFTYGDSASTPVYTKPEGTLKTSVTYSKKDGTSLAEAPAETGEYTVTVVCETKDTAYSGSANYTIKPKPISDLTFKLSEDKFTYNGGEQKPNITVKMNETDLTDTDYTVAYPTNTTDVGAKEVKILGIGNFSGEKTVSYQINKATVKVKPKDISKVYGDEPKYKLESKSSLITEQELEKVAASAIFESGGAEKNAHVTANGYIISVQSLGTYEPANLTLEVDGTGKLTVEKADLTITVKDVSREYGAANPALEVTYSGFVNGENESVLNGELVPKYDESKINEQTAVGFYKNATTAEGLTSGDYNINYVSGNVDITKIKVNASAGTAKSSYLSAVFDKSLEGLSAKNFIVKDSEGNEAAVNNATASSDGKTYTLSGSFEVGREYTVKVVLNGAAADATYQLATDEFVITPIRTSGGGGTSRYTIAFDSNGGSKVSSLRVSRNAVAKEPGAPTKDGFDFAGWYTDKELKVKYDFSEKVTKSITLYAAWTEKDNSVNQIILTIGEKSAKVFGQIKTNDVAPKIVNDRTMLPARFVAENLGADVSWDGDREIVTVKGRNLKTDTEITILIYIGSDIAYVNGREVKLDSPAFIENDRTYTPIRFISEELDASVEWLEDEQRVVITK